jgi:hypothetical protein
MKKILMLWMLVILNILSSSSTIIIGIVGGVRGDDDLMYIGCGLGAGCMINTLVFGAALLIRYIQDRRAASRTDEVNRIFRELYDELE